MTIGLEEFAIFLILTAVIGTAGVGLGIFLLAPRLSRLADRSDEDDGAGND